MSEETADHERKKPTNGVAKSMMTKSRKDLSVEMKLVRFQENEDTKNGPDRLASGETLATFETPTIGNEHETDRRADNTAEIEGKIHEYHELHLRNLRIVDNTDLDHLRSHQETLDAERTIITNEILETDNTVKDHKRHVGIDPDRPDTMNQQMPTGNKRTMILYNGGTNKS